MALNAAQICRPDLDAKAFVPDFTVKGKFDGNSGAGDWWKATEFSMEILESPWTYCWYLNMATLAFKNNGAWGHFNIFQHATSNFSRALMWQPAWPKLVAMWCSTHGWRPLCSCPYPNMHWYIYTYIYIHIIYICIHTYICVYIQT